MVHTLLYADDLVLVAETPEDLPTQLDVLKDFTEKYHDEDQYWQNQSHGFKEK